MNPECCHVTCSDPAEVLCILGPGGTPRIYCEPHAHRLTDDTAAIVRRKIPLISASQQTLDQV